MTDKREKVLLFYNPNSGNGLFKNNLDRIIEKIQDKGYQVVPVRAGRGMPIEQAFGEINEGMYRQVIVAGGDGTINICVNAMMKYDINLPLGIFPTGTANDFAYYLELPDNIDSMVDIAMGECYTYADVGICNEKHFVNVAAIGNMVDVSQKTDPNLKNTLGIFSYYLKGFTEVANLKALPIKLTHDEGEYECEMFFMLVMNGMSAGGFKKLSPESEINDGLFNVIVFKKMPYIEFPQLFFDVLRGKHTDNKNIMSFMTKELLVESSEDISTDVDGEKGGKLPLKFSMLPRKLKIFTAKNNI